MLNTTKYDNLQKIIENGTFIKFVFAISRKNLSKKSRTLTHIMYMTKTSNNTKAGGANFWNKIS